MENQGEKNSHGDESSKAEELDVRKSEATTDETVSDLQETEKDSGSTSSDPDPGPSPDGALDDSDKIRGADPM